MIAIGVALVAGGLAFLTVSTVGLLRLPDLYTRTHAVAKSETVGLALIFLGLLFFPQMSWEVGIRLGLVLVFAVLANPTAVHTLARAAKLSGVEPMAGRTR